MPDTPILVTFLFIYSKDVSETVIYQNKQS